MTGMLSTGLSLARQWGQRDAGQMTDSRSGKRWMQTLRKLPTTMPIANVNTDCKTSISEDLRRALVRQRAHSAADAEETRARLVPRRSRDQGCTACLSGRL